MPPRIAQHLQSKANRIKALRVRRDGLRSSIAVLARGSAPPAALREALRTELAGVKDELGARGVDP